MLKRLKFIITDSEPDNNALGIFAGFLNLASHLATDATPTLVQAVQLKELLPNERFLYKAEEYRVIKHENNKARVRSAGGIEMQMSDFETVEKILLEETNEEKD